MNRSNGKSLNPILKKSKGKQDSTRKFVFQSFAQRVASTSIDQAFRLRVDLADLRDEADAGRPYSLVTLERWADENLTAAYVAFRKELGRVLAREHAVDADMVVPVLDSGNAAALGYGVTVEHVTFGTVRVTFFDLADVDFECEAGYPCVVRRGEVVVDSCSNIVNRQASLGMGWCGYLYTMQQRAHAI